MSTLKADTIQSTGGGAATLTNQTAAKAWVNFDGTGTVAIRDSFNVSAITDNGTGNYTVNFTSAVSNANYAVAVSGSGPYSTPPPSVFGCSCENFTSSNFQMFTRAANSVADQNPICAVVFGD